MERREGIVRDDESYGWFGPNLPFGVTRLTEADSQYLRARSKRLKREGILGGIGIDIDSNYIDCETEVHSDNELLESI